MCQLCLYLILVSDAEVLWSLPAACGQVEDRCGSHVGSFGIMGIIIATGGAFSINTVQAGTWGGDSGEWRFGCGQKRIELILKILQSLTANLAV